MSDSSITRPSLITASSVISEPGGACICLTLHQKCVSAGCFVEVIVLGPKMCANHLFSLSIAATQGTHPDQPEGLALPNPGQEGSDARSAPWNCEYHLPGSAPGSPLPALLLMDTPAHIRAHTQLLATSSPAPERWGSERLGGGA